MIDDDTATSQPPDAPSGLYGADGRPQFFSDPAMDRFVATLLNLASEVWVQEERILTLETGGLQTRGPETPGPETPGPETGGPETGDTELGASGQREASDRDGLLRAFIERVFAPLRETG